VTELRPLLSAAEVAHLLGISRKCFYNLAWFRRRAVYVTPRRPRWKQEDVETYLREHHVSSHMRMAS
jgi:predicted DNA-binding transcriptional regulator AlpA